MVKKSLRLDKNKKKNRNKFIVIGAIIFVLCCVGFYNISSFIYINVNNIVTGKNKIIEYENFIAPVVLMDVVPFESVDKLDEKIRLQVGIWSLVTNKKTENYKTTESGQTLIPAVDIEAECAKIFGPNQKFTHESFADYQSQFYYDESTQSYKLPITGRVGYIPQISKVERDNHLTKLTVNYIPPQTWSGDAKGNKLEPTSDKTLYYFLDKKGDNKFITKIELVSQN